MAATKNTKATIRTSINAHASIPAAEGITRAVSFSRYAARGFGTLYLVHAARGLAAIEFDVDDARRAVGKKKGGKGEGEEVACPEPLREALDRYFRGEGERFEEIELEFSGTEFQLRVWEELRRIPYGEVITYGELAARIGSPNATRAVGNANSKNPIPIIIPCHRVVAGGMRIGGYTGGIRRKVDLLTLEGHEIDGDTVRRPKPGLFDALGRSRPN